jgi:hypothetical protein
VLVRDAEATEEGFFFLIGRSAVAEAMAGQATIRKKSSALRANPVPLAAEQMKKTISL